MTQTLLILLAVTVLVLLLVLILEFKVMMRECQALKIEVAEDYERVMQRLENPESWEDLDMHRWRWKKKENGSSVEIV